MFCFYLKHNKTKNDASYVGCCQQQDTTKMEGKRITNNEPNNYKVGQSVMAQWKEHSHPAKITFIYDDGKLNLEFEDGNHLEHVSQVCVVEVCSQRSS